MQTLRFRGSPEPAEFFVGHDDLSTYLRIVIGCLIAGSRLTADPATTAQFPARVIAAVMIGV